jgi:hypothetical protein
MLKTRLGGGFVQHFLDSISLRTENSLPPLRRIRPARRRKQVRRTSRILVNFEMAATNERFLARIQLE